MALFDPSRRIADQYRRALHAALDRFLDSLRLRELTDPSELLALLEEYWSSQAVTDFLAFAARRMITGLSVENARSWREAARKSTRGRMLYEALQAELAGMRGTALQALVDENARLISTFPQDIAGPVATFVKEETLKGRRAAAIAQDLKRQFPKVSKGRLALISRTEAGKASTALTQVRAEALDLDWYVWRTSEDARVRPSHRRMDGVLVAWKEPPSPEALAGITSTLGNYQAAASPNCRCLCEPLLDLDQVPFPAKVYHAGVIQRMSRRAFSRLAGLEVLRAS